MILASAMLFGFVHIIFGSWISIALTAAGGVLFGMTYRKSGSLLLACLEHALFGDFIFTIGIGRYFYHLARH
jgi:membrane protease YdiL (CAAX protease family)